MSTATVPPFTGNISFNAQHAPMGAFFSFTCGQFRTRGGLGLQLGRPANQDIYVGVKDGPRHAKSPLQCLPFFQTDHLPHETTPSQQPATKNANQPSVCSIATNLITRRYGWGSDTWESADLLFAVFTPFGPIPEPDSASPHELRQAILPAVVAELAVDNTNGHQPKTAFFAVAFDEPGARIIDCGLGIGRVGFALGRSVGVAAEVYDCTASCDNAIHLPDAPFSFMRSNLVDGLTDPNNPVHRLGNCPGLGFVVPPGKRYVMTIAIGSFVDGPVTTRLEGAYAYTRCVTSLNDVLDQALSSWDQRVAAAKARDRELIDSGLSPDQQFLLSHATRSYYGATQLLDVAGQPFWIVNEGEYCMINTLDLAIDHVFWELRYNPWVVRNLLDNFRQYYSYTDQCGLSFCHDMGVRNNFSPRGHSSYELPHLTGCFSYMTQEQLCNWIIMAACYVSKTADLSWLERNRPTIAASAQSMLNRDHPDPQHRTGTMRIDSSRCQTGAEITTYDSLDQSLGQARNSLYLAVKCFAAYVGLAKLYAHLSDLDERDRWITVAAQTAETITSQMLPDGFLPALFEPHNPAFRSRILPAIEPLAYVLYWDYAATVLNPDGPFAEFLHALQHHTLALLADPQSPNLFPDGGLRLSSSSDNTWLSKIFLFQHVACKVFRVHQHPKLSAVFPSADAAHVKWLTEGPGAYWAFSDQIVHGTAKESKYYPRGVTSVLWLDRQ